MDQATHNKIVAVLLGNTDDVLHDGRKSRGSYSPLRTPLNISADILAIEKKEMLNSLLVGGTPT